MVPSAEIDLDVIAQETPPEATVNCLFLEATGGRLGHTDCPTTGRTVTGRDEAKVAAVGRLHVTQPRDVLGLLSGTPSRSVAWTR